MYIYSTSNLRKLSNYRYLFLTREEVCLCVFEKLGLIREEVREGGHCQYLGLHHIGMLCPSAYVVFPPPFYLSRGSTCLHTFSSGLTSAVHFRTSEQVFKPSRTIEVLVKISLRL